MIKVSLLEIIPSTHANNLKRDANYTQNSKNVVIVHSRYNFLFTTAAIFSVVTVLYDKQFLYNIFFKISMKMVVVCEIQWPKILFLRTDQIAVRITFIIRAYMPS